MLQQRPHQFFATFFPLKINLIHYLLAGSFYFFEDKSHRMDSKKTMDSSTHPPCLQSRSFAFSQGKQQPKNTEHKFEQNLSDQ